jgi:hypothetical protein
MSLAHLEILAEEDETRFTELARLTRDRVSLSSVG